jgi:hypothetical protein
MATSRIGDILAAVDGYDAINAATNSTHIGRRHDGGR